MKVASIQLMCQCMRVSVKSVRNSGGSDKSKYLKVVDMEFTIVSTIW